MFKLFISKDALTDLYVNHADNPTDWLKVIQKQKKLFLMNNQGDIDTDLSNPDSLLYMYLTATGKTVDLFESSSITISDIQTDPSKVLENPCGCYLLDTDRAETEAIQKKYGVICQSTEEYQECPLIIEEFPISPKERESGYDWDCFSNTCSRIPSNALIINDRNLFHDKTNNDLHGLKNIEEILQSLLPDTFGADYHVGIIIGSESGRPIISSPFDYKMVVDELGKMKKRINKPYPIIISFIIVDKGDQTCWGKTHDRRIVSNYFYLTSDHKFAAFWNGKSTCTQSINLIPIFCKGLVSGADAPEKDQRDKIEGYKFVISHWKSNPNNKFASGLNLTAKIEDIQHRLLK